MSFCPNCGTEILVKKNFCPKCGNSFKGDINSLQSEKLLDKINFGFFDSNNKDKSLESKTARFLANITGTQYFFGNLILYLIGYFIGYYFGLNYGVGAETKTAVGLLAITSFILPYFRTKRFNDITVFYIISAGILLQLFAFLFYVEEADIFESLDVFSKILIFPCNLYLIFANAKK